MVNWKDKEEVKEYKRLHAIKWRTKNRKHFRKYKRLYYQKYKDKIDRKRENERFKIYSKKNKIKRFARYKAIYEGLRDIKCLNCETIENLHFHHTNYEKNEGITLCKDCHNKIHFGE